MVWSNSIGWISWNARMAPSHIQQARLEYIKFAVDVLLKTNYLATNPVTMHEQASDEIFAAFVCKKACHGNRMESE